MKTNYTEAQNEALATVSNEVPNYQRPVIVRQNGNNVVVHYRGVEDVYEVTEGRIYAYGKSWNIETLEAKH